MILKVKVTPNAKQNRIVGWKGDVLKIQIAAHPEKGKANIELIDFLSKTFKIPKRAIVLVKGVTSREKIFSLEGVSKEELLKIGLK